MVGKRPLEWQFAENLPTEKQQKFLDKFIEKGSDLSAIKECGIEAGYSSNSAFESGKNALKKIARNSLMQAALYKNGVTIERIAKKVGDLMEAEHPAYEGKPDNHIQHKALETAIDLFDVRPAKKVNIESRETLEFVMTEEINNRVRRAKQIEAEVITLLPENQDGTKQG